MRILSSCAIRMFPLAAVTLLAGGGLAFSASALPTVDIVFTATTGAGTVGSNTIDAATGDVLTAELRLSPDAAGVSSYGISLLFDTDLLDELDIVSVTETLPPGFDLNLNDGVDSTQESTNAVRGEILTFEAATFGNGPVEPATVVIGIVEFGVTTNVATDGDDIFSGLFSVGVDDVFDNDSNNISSSVAFGAAAVNAVPEPTTAAMLSLGLIGLGLYSTRSRIA